MVTEGMATVPLPWSTSPLKGNPATELLTQQPSPGSRAEYTPPYATEKSPQELVLDKT